MDKLRLGFKILNILHENSYDAYIVGGAVRDYVRQAPIKDVDIATNALPEEIGKLFPEVSYEGEKYYSCRVHLEGITFEVTTFRKEITYFDHRHPEFQPVQSIEEDLARRDFTMNALAMKSLDLIIDPFNGIKDIENGIIRMIGNPSVRFNEDALRVLRALDFASRWNYQLEQSILDSFSEDYVKYLKEEYIISMIKRIASNPFSNGLKYICDYKIFRSFPFYQVVCEDACGLKYGKNVFALFYTLHNFLPANCILSRQERVSARDIAYWVRHSFDSISLYYGNPDCIEEAIELYNHLYHKKSSYGDVIQQIQRLPIHSSKDIKVDWTQFPVESRGRLTKKVERAILLGKIKNEEQEVKQFLETEE